MKINTDDILHDLDLLDDFLAMKGYGEEAGLVLRAMTLINAQARELRELRAALKPLVAELDDCPNDDYEHALVSFSDLRAAAAALKESE